MPSERDKQIVEKPLTPAVLEDIGIVKDFPKPPPDFNPDKNWKHLYRIWLCHGFYGQLNLDAGYLCIERVSSDSQNRFTLTVVQKQINWEGIVNTVNASIECYGNSISSPVNWKYSNEFTGKDGLLIPELCVEHTGKIENDTVKVEINGIPTEFKAGTSITSDWCLFDAVQRLPFDESSNTRFDVLEGLTVSKSGQRLFYNERPQDHFKNFDISLHRFVQIGSGILPYEYWLDRHHRLLMAISGDRAYILDGNAEQIFEKEVAQHRGGEYSWQNIL